MDKQIGPTGRVGGDFDVDAIEAFRAAYAQQLAAPDDDNIANNSGLPTNTIGNVSPWHDHLPLWKYPSGKGPEEDLQQPFDPSAYYSNEVGDGEEDMEVMDNEEVEQLVNEIAGGRYGEDETEYEEE